MINKKESSVFQELQEKDEERYSLYELNDLVHIILTLMEAYEEEAYHSIERLPIGKAIIEAYQPTDKTKRIVIDKPLIDYIDLKLEHTPDEAMALFGFGPSNSRFKLELGEEQDLEYIQDFADVLFEYRREHEITDLPFDELNDLIKRYIGISQYEIDARKSKKKQNISDEKSYQKK